MGVFKIKRIKADDLPSLPYDTKYLINSGFWFLYEISGGKKEEKYCLSSDNQKYLLNQDGEPVEVAQKMPNVSFRVLFNDIKVPFINEIKPAWSFSL